MEGSTHCVYVRGWGNVPQIAWGEWQSGSAASRASTRSTTQQQVYVKNSQRRRTWYTRCFSSQSKITEDRLLKLRLRSAQKGCCVR